MTNKGPSKIKVEKYFGGNGRNPDFFGEIFHFGNLKVTALFSEIELYH